LATQTSDQQACHDRTDEEAEQISRRHTIDLDFAKAQLINPCTVNGGQSDQYAVANQCHKKAEKKGAALIKRVVDG